MAFLDRQALPGGAPQRNPIIFRIFRRRRILYAADLGLCLAAYVLAVVLRLGVQRPVDVYRVQIEPGVLFLAVCAVALPLAGLYRQHWRHLTMDVLFTILKASGLAAVLVVFIDFVATRAGDTPRSIVLIAALLLAGFLSGLRLLFRLHGDRISRRAADRAGLVRAEEARPVLLVGAGKAADQFLRALEMDPDPIFRPLGILDDEADARGLAIRRTPVLGALSDLRDVVAALEAKGRRPHHLILTETVGALGRDAAQRLLAEAEALGISAKTLPAPTELKAARVDAKFEVRSLEFEDLLERPQAKLDPERLKRLVSGRRVLVTGAGGSIGSELVKQIAGLGAASLVLADDSEYNLWAVELTVRETHPSALIRPELLDVRNAARVEALFRRHRPELVFHAAALKHVPMVEAHPCEGVTTNVFGSVNVADAARRHGARAMVLISTDKAVSPTNVMGATKRTAELYCQALDLEGEGAPGATRFMTVRFGNVLGSSGSLIPLFKRQLERGGPLTVTDPRMTRFFMTIREAVELTLHASAHGLQEGAGRGEIFVLDMGEPIRIVDVARRMIRLCGLEPDRDVKISFIGIRPGEKLHEELLDDSEGYVPSDLDRILRAAPRPKPLTELRQHLSALRATASAGDVEATVAELRRTVPNYRPNRPAPVAETAAADIPAVQDLAAAVAAQAAPSPLRLQAGKA